MQRLKQAAVLYNASAALHLSDDLKAAGTYVLDAIVRNAGEVRI